MIIKKYIDFINEKMGVPDKIINSATNLYNLILADFKQKSQIDETIFDMVKSGFNDEYEIDLPIKIEIGDLTYNSAVLEVQLHPAQYVEKGNVDVISWGMLNMPDSQNNYKLLKHTYDKYMFGKTLLGDIVDYQTWAQTRTGFQAIDDFIYYLYIISKTESLVRSSEIAGELQASDITKSDFKEFIQNNSTYKKLIKIKNFTYDGLKQELQKDIQKVRSLFKDLTDESDEEVIDEALEITYRMIIGESAERLADMLRLNDPNLQKMRDLEVKIFGMCRDTEFFENYIKQRIFKSKEDFFLFWEKKLNFEAEKVIKKIVKLYDMCKDDNVNPLMAKINSRDNGQCIVNPKLYNELIVKPNRKYKAKK